MAAALLAGVAAGGLELAALHYAFGVAPSVRGFLIDLAYGCVAATAMLALASPAWRVLHLRGHRTWYAAGLLGAGLTLAVCLVAALVFAGPSLALGMRPGDFDVADELFRLSWFVFVGATMGLIVWRVAYRRAPR